MSNKLDDTAVARLEDASKWLMTEAVAGLYQKPDIGEKIQSLLVERFGLRSYNHPQLDTDNGQPRFIPFTRGIYYDISVVTSQTFNNNYFEYWIIAATQQAWASTSERCCRFIVTRAQSNKADRTIIKNEGSFFAHYDVDGRVIFKLSPETDLELRNRLTPWLLSGCFENFPELLDKEVGILQDGTYVLRPISAIGIR
jgi:hypothetical protein